MMQDIEKQAILTYKENLEFLEETQPALFRKINDFNSAIANNYYKERYSLEYKDGYFDVLELQTNRWLYNTNSIEHAKLIAKSVDFTKTNNVYETFKNVPMAKKVVDEFEEVDIENSAFAGAASLMHYAYTNAPATTTMKKIYKFIFLGVGLGLHITEIDKKINSNIYFIIEDDLELFRLSLFVTNYKDITKNGANLVFSIFDEESEFKNQVQVFLNLHFVYNQYIKFFPLLSHSEEKLKTIHGIIVGQTYLVFNFSALSVSLTRPLIHLKNGYKLLDIGTLDKEEIFKQKPVLILGAGPSFQNNIEWLKQNHKKFIVVAVTALLSKLEELNIKPDVITHVHGFKDARPHIQKVKNISFFDKTIAIFGGFSEPAFIKYLKKENIFLFEGSSRYKRWMIGLTSSNIGSMTYGLFLLFGTKNIYTLGLDFALDQKSGSTHSDTHKYTRSLELKEDKELTAGLEYRDATLKTKGNLKDEVFTTLLMDGWKDECNAIAKSYRTPLNENIYNLSDGAYLNDTIPLSIDDEKVSSLEEINKDELYKDLKTILDKKSENFLTEDEIEVLKTKIDYCTHLESVVNKHIHTSHYNVDQYHYDLLGVFQELLAEKSDLESSDMDYILTLYMQLVSGYIFDLINTVEIKDEQKLMKDLDESVMPKILKIIAYFKHSIENYLK